uniref:Uncharacterized protein n=1 Tax=Grammatophora oceanica TaxID=210454 RepID=A0A7S1VVA5_9STRA
MDELVKPQLLLLDPVMTQQDTFLGQIPVKIYSYTVPVYLMKQPSRISKDELPFSLILVQDIESPFLQEFPVDDPTKAMDSWFPGYSWIPVAYPCGERMQHVGWKYVNKDGDFFYGVVVKVDPTRADGFHVATFGTLKRQRRATAIRT